MVNLSYRSVKFIKVNNTKLAILHYAIQILILTYVVVYTIVVRKGYQQYDSLIGSSALKVKGSALQNQTIYDSIDLVQPAIENDALFITTGFIQTSQTRGVCEGNKAKCADGCTAGEYTTNGVLTGQCGSSGEYCEVSAWCPMEKDDDTAIKTLDHVEDWTTFVKVNIRYPLFNVSTTNAVNDLNSDNLFTLGQFLERAHVNFTDIVKSGAILSGQWRYDCDLNHGIEACNPTIEFAQLSDPTSKLSPGFNFRYAIKSFDKDTGEETRVLTKAIGVRIVFSVSGQGGQFSIVPLLVTFGAGMALLSVSTLICDLVMTYCLKRSQFYEHEKFEELVESRPASMDATARPPTGVALNADAVAYRAL